MPFDAKIYRILIASPGDVGDERKAIPLVISEWNDLRAVHSKIVVLPVRWETHSSPLLGDRPQGIINEQLVKDCDLLVGLFWTRIGTHTGVAESGTIEEIEHFIKSGKPVMLYFSSQPIEPEKIDIEQYQKLKKFKEKVKPSGLFETYSSIQDLREKFSRQLAIHIQNIETGQPPVSLLRPSNKEIKEILSTDTIFLEDYEKNGKVNSILVRGNTTPVKEILKKNGGLWNSSLKGWLFPKKREIEIAQLIKEIK